MVELISVILSLLVGVFSWATDKDRLKEKKGEVFDEALVEDDFNHLGSELSDNFDRMPD